MSSITHSRLVYMLVFCLLGAVCMHGQSISYTYDAAGNRTSRQVITLPPQNVKKQPTDSVVVQDRLEERTILIYPNPTRGALRIDIAGGNPDEKLRIILYSGQGTMLYHADAHIGSNPLDMSIYPKGWYILQIQAGESRREFKVIKE